MNHIYNDSGKKETLAIFLSGDNKTLWATALSNKWGRVDNFNTFGIKGTQTLEFIAKKWPRQINQLLMALLFMTVSL